MKRIILCLSLFAFFGSQAQQINPVPDYVFSNKMSVGRNAVTDTAAYFSIGPRYGAIRGMMPPMVTDTASMSATKRNGLLIFSIQKNKYLYWDSVGSKWAEMAGTAGSAITGSGVAGYMPEFTTATNIDTTRLYHSNGRFAIGSTTTTNGVFNVYSGQSYMDSSLKIGNGELIVGTTSSASRKLYVTSNAGVARFEQTASDGNMVIELRHTNPNASGTGREEGINFLAPNTSTRGRITFYPSDTFNVRNYFGFFTPTGSGTTAERLRIANDGNIGIGTTNPLSQLEVNSISTRVRVVGTTGGAVNQYVTDGGQMFVGIENSSASLFGNGAYSRVIYGGGAYPLDFYTNDLIRARIKSDGEVLIGTTTDAGAYPLQVAGGIYATQGTVLATVSGNVGIATTNPTYKLDVLSNARVQGSSTSPPTDTNSDLALTVGGYSGTTTGNGSLGIFGSARGVLTLGSNYSDGAINNGIIQFVSGVLSTTSMNSALVGRILSQQTNGTNTMGAHIIFETKQTSGSLAERMRIKDDGELLIGTTTDAGAYALQVAGSIYNTTGAVLAASSGNVGIGTTSPGANLDVSMQGTQGSGQNTRTIRISGAGDDASVLEFFNAWTGNAFVRAKITSDGDGASQAYGTLKFYTTQNSSAGTTERMRISSGGNVGIGTTTPSQPLHVNGNILTSAPSGGTAKPFKIGEAATVSPTSPNRTIRVEIDGTVYYIHAKTTND